ncbi:uncharacterized protein LOC136090106 isoform X2 [Hydra vulgaris]|uniref:Uncharacterized protein LOC136090106 isoform X2 n=1 Tax=Hydra vulgaris TaxID=6087 RepID=A0ABM4DCZ9_HYDVU
MQKKISKKRNFQYTIIKLVTKVIDRNQQNISQQPTAHVVYEPLVRYQTFDDFIKFDNLLRIGEDVAKNLIDRLQKIESI